MEHCAGRRNKSRDNIEQQAGANLNGKYTVFLFLVFILTKELISVPHRNKQNYFIVAELLVVSGSVHCVRGGLFTLLTACLVLGLLLFPLSVECAVYFFRSSYSTR